MRAQDLVERARRSPRRIVLADGDDGRATRAATLAHDAGLGDPILLSAGPPPGGAAAYVTPASDPRRSEFADELAGLRGSKGLTPEQAYDLMADPLYFGGMMVRAGAADGMVAGATRPTGDVIRAAIQTIGPAPGTTRVSSFFLMCPREGPALTFADCGVIVRPTSEELAEIALAAAISHRDLTGERPRTAFLSFSTHGSAEHAELENIRRALSLARAGAAERGLDARDFDGELQVDAALVPEVAKAKAPASTLAGRANVLIFPDLASGNIGYKLVQRLGGAEAYGPILQGLARPANDLSRGATAADILAVIAITTLQASATSSQPLLH